MPKKDFINETMSKIEGTKPISKTTVLLRNIGFGTIILLLSFFVAWLLSSYIYDVFYTVFIDKTGILGVSRIGDTVVELLILSIIAVLLLVLIYRRTDWPLVRHQFALVFLVIAVVGVGGGVLVTFASGEFLESPTSIVDRLPYREERKKIIQSRLEERDIVSGKLTSVNSRSREIEITNDKGSRKYIYLAQNRSIEELRLGDMIVAKTGREENAVIWINILPPKDELPKSPRQVFQERRLKRLQ